MVDALLRGQHQPVARQRHGRHVGQRVTARWCPPAAAPCWLPQRGRAPTSETGLRPGAGPVGVRASTTAGAVVDQQAGVVGAGERPRRAPAQQPSPVVVLQTGGAKSTAGLATPRRWMPDVAPVRVDGDRDAVQRCQGHASQRVGVVPGGGGQDVAFVVGDRHDHVREGGAGQAEEVEQVTRAAAQPARVGFQPTVQRLRGQR